MSIKAHSFCAEPLLKSVFFSFYTMRTDQKETVLCAAKKRPNYH